MSLYAEHNGAVAAIAAIDAQLHGALTPAERTRLMARREELRREAASLWSDMIREASIEEDADAQWRDDLGHGDSDD